MMIILTRLENDDKFAELVDNISWVRISVGGNTVIASRGWSLPVKEPIEYVVSEINRLKLLAGD